METITIHTAQTEADPERWSALRKASIGLGVAIYAASFFMPAVVDRDLGSSMPGYLCAWATLFKGWGWLPFAAGFVNIIVTLLLILQLLKAPAVLRRLSALFVLGLIPMSWIFMAQAGIWPHIGHVCWIAGMLLIAGGDTIPTRNRT